ncbi:hypothetical protein [Pleionea sediminis]|uniref:hypothetical protein n=1 Tax=Pleionea sediminis TaxID=2569479 RepID=UPI00118706BC|nr:hypothetical protein [Pleionea sediminis]
MPDTTHMEYTAEDLIAHKLQKANLLVAKPKFDREGCDLLVFKELKDGVKFCRIQCKGRTVIENTSSVEIPKQYVSPSLIVFLYVEDGTTNSDDSVFIFNSTDIEKWNYDQERDIYKLHIPKDITGLSFNKLDSGTIRLVESAIKSAEIHGDFKRVIHGRMESELSGFRSN